MAAEPTSMAGQEWYFTRSQIDQYTPSRLDGINAVTEDDLRVCYCAFIQCLGIDLGLQQVSIATAIILCHCFYMRQSHTKCDRYTVASSCVLLANKVTGPRRRILDNLTLTSYTLLHENADSATLKLIEDPKIFQQSKQLLLKGEHLVLATLNFDLDIETPHKHLASAIKKFKAEGWHSKFAQVAWNFANDGVMTTVCLQFQPCQVAGAAFYLASSCLRVQLPLDTENAWGLEFDMSIAQLKHVSSQLLEFDGT